MCIRDSYTAERKKELLPFATAWMELESIMLSEISQVVRDKYHIGNMINKRKRQTKYNQRHGNKEKTDSNQREVGGDNGVKRRKGCQGTCIKDPWTTPKARGRIEGRRWG